MKSETMRLQHEQNVMKEKIRDNGEKIKQNKVLPYLVGNVVEVRICVLFLQHILNLLRSVIDSRRRPRWRRRGCGSRP
jgi:hypothetical protein